jgi:hypothetical protein
VVTGISVSPVVLDGRVVYFRPDPSANLAARLIVAAADTGRDLLVSDPMVFRSRPAHCPDGKDVCVTVSDGGRPGLSRRFSVEAGGPVPDPTPIPPGSRFLGEDLLDLGQRQPEVLAGLHDGKVRWQAPLSRHFPAGYSSDHGWHFALYKSAGLHVGSVDYPADRERLSTVVIDLGKVHTAAIDAASGASAWQSDGTSFACQAKIALDRRVEGDRTELWPVRCRYRGTAHVDRATGGITFEGLDVTVEGFEVSTGRTTWTVPLGPAEAFMAEEAEATALGDSEVLVAGASGPLIIDLADGSTRRPPKGEAFWCARNVTFTYRERIHFPDGESSDTWRGGALLSRCRPDRSPTSAVPRRIATSLGATVGNRTVLAEPGGLVAYDRKAR